MEENIDELVAQLQAIEIHMKDNRMPLKEYEARKSQIQASLKALIIKQVCLGLEIVISYWINVFN